MNIVNKIKEKNRLIAVIAYIVFIIIMNINFYTKFINLQEQNINSKIIYLVLSIIISVIIGLLILFIHKEKNLKPEKVFVILALILGTMNMLSTPLLRGHDEAYHWYKSYAVSMGKLVQIKNEEGWQGDNLPSKVSGIYEIQGEYKDIDFASSKKAWKYARDDSKTNDIRFTYNAPTAMYPPIQMIPQAIGIFLARTIGLDVYMQGMFGRLGNLIFFVVMGYFAIKLLPRKKYFLVLLLLCPKVVYISSTMSGDVFVNMTAILFTSYIFKLREEKKLLTKKDIAILLILTPCIAVSKLVYFAICGLVLLIPKECFKNENKKALFVGTVGILMMISMFAWVAIANLPVRPVYSCMQADWVFANPISYLGVLIRGVCNNFATWALDMVGGAMAWHSDVNQEEIVSIIIYIVLFLSLLQDEKREKEKYKVSEYIGIITIALIVIAGIITALYLEFTAMSGIGGTEVTGVQGRYFTPLALILTAIVPVKYIETKKKIDIRWLYIITILCQIPTLMNMLAYYI